MFKPVRGGSKALIRSRLQLHDMVLPGTPAPELDVEGWLNSPPLSVDEGTLLLDFWSSSCSNCMEKLGHMQSIHERFNVDVVGIHTPELGFEKERQHLRKVARKHSIDYPLAHDMERNTWNAYSNYRSPGQVLVRDGEVEWKHRGDINGLEQRLAKTVGGTTRGIREVRSFREHPLGAVHGKGINNEPNFTGAKTFKTPENRLPGKVYLGGAWRREKQYLEALEDAELHYIVEDSGLKAVVDPGDAMKDVHVEVRGEHDAVPQVSRRGYTRVKNPGVVELVRSADGEVILEPEPGVKLYSLAREE